MDGYSLDEIVIRPATLEDADAVAELWERLVAYHQSLDAELPPATANGKHYYAEHLSQRLEDDHARAFVAVTRSSETNGSSGHVGEKIVGYALGVMIDLVPELFEQEPSGFLADIFVDDAYRRHGVGRSLVEATAEWFRQRGAAYFEWHVAAHNPDGIAFWRSLGGHEVMLRMRADIKEQSAFSDQQSAKD